MEYDGTLEGLFALLDRLWTGGLPEERRPLRVRRQPGGPGSPPVRKNPQAGLFDGGPAGGGEENPAIPGGFRPAPGREFPAPPALLPDPAALDGAAGILFQVSADAYDALVYAWMSAFPIEAQALRYALKVLAAAAEATARAPGEGRSPWYTRGEAREGAVSAARNRGDDDCRTVLEAAYKAAHEVDRLRGFLRFKPDAQGRYEARCAPDHFVLPALEPHFTRRFGDTPWAVVDEKRGLALVMEGEPRIVFTGGGAPFGEDAGGGPRFRAAGDRDPWEKLWRSYHRTVNIENRKNLSLQRQFVPLRYREYLTEFDPE